MTVQFISRKGSFDSAHRVMNEKVKCFNIHGHTYLFELTFSFTQSKEIGYALDFKEIKRIGSQWIDDMLDHASILNPLDEILIKAASDTKSKSWIMSLNGINNYCNPTVENISKEIFLTMEILFEKVRNLNVFSVRLYETPNCFTDCISDSISNEERINFIEIRKNEISRYAHTKGVIEYDDRVGI